MTSEQNPRSGVVHNLNFNSPIAGGADLRLDFELANDSDSPQESAFLQFVTWRIPVQAPGDLGGAGQISAAHEGRQHPHRAHRTGQRTPTPRWTRPATAGKRSSPEQTKELILDLGAAKLPGGGTQGVVSLDEVLQQVRAVVITPEPRGRGDNGLFDRGKTDLGFLELDDVQIQ